MFTEITSRETMFDNELAVWAPHNDLVEQVVDAEEVLKDAIHTHSCACLACHSDKTEDGLSAIINNAAFSVKDVQANINTTETLAPGSFKIADIGVAGESDWYRISLEAGETYTFTTFLPGGGLSDSILTLRDSDGVAITTNDDANTGARLFYSEITFTATTSGDYFVDVSGFGNATGRYVVSSSRPVDDAVAGDASTTAVLTVDAAATSGELDETGDRDWYEVTLEAGQIYEFTTSSTGSAGDVDTTLTLRTTTGEVIAYNDDSTGTYSQIRFTAAQSGTFYLDVGGWADGEAGSYQVDVAIGEPLREFTNDEIAGQLLYGSGTPADIRRWNASEGDTITVNITSLTETGQLLAREALKLWTDVTGINFAEVTSGGQIMFQDTEDGAYAQTARSGGFITGATVNVSTNWLATQGTTLDSYSFQTYIHEVGHALGLGHGGNYNGDATYSQDASYLNDSWATTVMSYFSQTENTFFNDQGFSRVFSVTPMSADIIAIQLAYGATVDTRTGDNTYGVGNDTGRLTYGVGDEATNNFGNLLAFTIIDNGGEDTLNYSSFSASQSINLNAETFSNVGGSTGNLSIARGTVIENAIAGSGADELFGNDVGNILTGGLGDDTIDGGSNVDTAVVSGNSSAYTITQLSTGVFEVVGADGTDTLSGIEFLRFDNETVRLLRGEGVSVNFETADTSVYQGALEGLRDFDGNDLGGDGSWLRIGSADVNGDGDIDQILVNDAIGRFATVGTAPDGLVYFDDHSWAGETRVAGIYIDPLVASGDVVAGSDSDSQTRFQNDLAIENINRVLGADDYDNDGIQEVYFALTDGTAFLRALMHEDGNIRYANYQSEQEVRDYLTANGFGEDTFGDWFGDGSQSNNQPAGQSATAAIDKPVTPAVPTVISEAIETDIEALYAQRYDALEWHFFRGDSIEFFG